MRNWLYAHYLAASQARKELINTPANTLLICFLIGFSLSVPGIFMVLISTANELTSEASQEPTITIFFQPELSETASQSLANHLKSWPAIDDIRYLSPATALDEFENNLGLLTTKKQDFVNESPLPATAILTTASSANINDLVATLVAHEGVAEVIFDQIWVTRLTALLSLADRLLLLLAVLLAGGVVLVTSNTLRFLLLARIAEFELLDIIGATHAYLMRPFLYTGFGYGLGGAIIAIIIIATSTIWLADPLGRLHSSYGILLTPESVAPAITGLALLAGPGLGVIGAWVAARWFLKASA